MLCRENVEKETERGRNEERGTREKEKERIMTKNFIVCEHSTSYVKEFRPLLQNSSANYKRVKGLV